MQKPLKYSPDSGLYTLQGAPLQPIRHQAYQNKPGWIEKEQHEILKCKNVTSNTWPQLDNSTTI